MMDPFIGRGQDLYRRAKTLIPGGTQLLSKRPELFLPERWPSYYARAEGCRVWDLDGRSYMDFTQCGVGTCVLGYADPDVNAAVHAAVDASSMTTLNAPEEVELAERLIALHPWAEMVRYARSGGEALAIAVRIARAATGRDVVAICGYHGWSDWYLSSNLADRSALDEHMLPNVPAAGVPGTLGGTTVPFAYNDIDGLKQIIARHGTRLGAIVMEPRGHSEPPRAGFLDEVRRLATDAGAVLVFDEVTSGWRVTSGGVHRTLGVDPDMAVFAKAMSNGYAMAAVLGRRSVMDYAQSTFISSTYWTERVGPAAALATIRKYEASDASAHLIHAGETIQRGWASAGQRAGVPLEVMGIAPLSWFKIGHPQADGLVTLFVQEMLRRGFLATFQCYTMLAHTDEAVGAYLGAVEESFEIVGAAIREGDLDRRLGGPVKHTGLKRIT